MVNAAWQFHLVLSDAAGQLNSMLYSIFRNHMATDICGEIGLQRI